MTIWKKISNNGNFDYLEVKYSYILFKGLEDLSMDNNQNLNDQELVRREKLEKYKNLLNKKGV